MNLRIRVNNDFFIRNNVFPVKTNQSAPTIGTRICAYELVDVGFVDCSWYLTLMLRNTNCGFLAEVVIQMFVSKYEDV